MYVTQRTESMMGMFYLATVYCSILYWATSRKAARATCLALAGLACVSGMLCKEMMASAPAMILLYERTFISGSFRRALSRSWPLYVALSLTWAPLLALNCGGFRTPSAGFGLGVAGARMVVHAGEDRLPVPETGGLAVAAGDSLRDSLPVHGRPGLALVAGGGTADARDPRAVSGDAPAAGFVAVWFFAVLSPTLLIPLVSETAAERRMYVPLAAIVPLFIVGGYTVLQRAWRFVARRAPRESILVGPIVTFSVAVLAMLVGFGYLTGRRLLVYQTKLALWQDAVVHQPHDPVVQYNVGTHLAQAGRVREAILHFQEAVRLDPESHRAHFNLGQSLEESGRPEEAVEHYRAVLRFASRPFRRPTTNLPGCLWVPGRREKPSRTCEKRLRHSRTFPRRTRTWESC